MRWSARIAGAVALVVLVVAAAAFYAIDQYCRPGPLLSASSVIIPKGTTVAGIAQMLEGAQVISAPLFFRVAVRLEGAESVLRAGEYQFPPGISMRDALLKLRTGDTVVRRFTLPEGMTSRQAVALLNDAVGLDGEVAAVPVEGAILPETYSYAWGDNRAEMIHRMAQAMTTAIDELWPERDPAIPLASSREAVILASIVEKETAVPGERPRVAAVFLNRLRLGMKLQADPTVAYAVYGGNDAAHPLTLADLQHASPYNTYVVEGLPPGPIANPGRAALEAVLRPAHSDELFFVADGSGGHAFARTLDEHQRNVTRWHKLNEQTSGQ
jgi:UPF0755 protein